MRDVAHDAGTRNRVDDAEAPRSRRAPNVRSSAFSYYRHMHAHDYPFHLQCCGATCIGKDVSLMHLKLETRPYFKMKRRRTHLKEAPRDQ